MAETFIIPHETDKEKKYKAILPQLEALLRQESDEVANMANVAAVLKETFQFFWCGFYVAKKDVLVLAPFQGPLACTRIAYGKGVCGTAWKNREVLIVPDVEKFPGHIACSTLSKSEIVVPMIHEGEVYGVLDIDSDSLNAFDETDAYYLTKVVALLTTDKSL